MSQVERWVSLEDIAIRCQQRHHKGVDKEGHNSISQNWKTM